MYILPRTASKAELKQLSDRCLEISKRILARIDVVSGDHRSVLLHRHLILTRIWNTILGGILRYSV